MNTAKNCESGEFPQLERFVAAQEKDFSRAIMEIEAGRKRSHWMWYIFPQLAGLGQSEVAQFYGIKGINEARAYLDHPVLGPRLRRSMETVLSVNRRTPKKSSAFRMF